ncbi:hypothetical protein [Peribacillus sp. Hz7]|uniref:hypothetical protein n=1 Tax=Peribacillus sp. Hz7 TaxID=3344873 RepID=UPI0035CBAFFC
MYAVSLQTMLESSSYNSLLHLKSTLIRNKAEGIVFYQEDISSLDWDVPFEFYYFLTAGNIKFNNAFPMPFAIYRKYLIKNHPLDYLVHFYQTYYETNSIPTNHFHDLDVFQAKQYVWFYNQKNEGKAFIQ